MKAMHTAIGAVIGFGLMMIAATWQTAAGHGGHTGLRVHSGQDAGQGQSPAGEKEGSMGHGATAAKAGSGSFDPQASSPDTTPVVYSPSGHVINRLPEARVLELAKDLNDEERRILLRAGTEAAFCGTLLDNKKEGTYICRLCGLPLFSSDSKFNSGTGWPSFHSPYDPKHIEEKLDTSHGMVRTEINCQRCGGHLGHVFDDGPRPTGLRYCLNSASLQFVDKGAEFPERSRPIETRTAYFAGGCFWGVEEFFQHQKGVIDAASGYQGGTVENPTYKQVCTGRTGHAESVRIVYDPTQTTYEELLFTFFRIHDPTQLNRQGWDVGTQYRSAIFVQNEEERAKAEAFIAAQQLRDRFKGRKIVTTIEPFGPFYSAEEYHQDYVAKTGRACHAPYE